MKKIILCLFLFSFVSCQTPPPKVVEPDSSSICQDPDQVRACVQKLRDLSAAEKWDEFQSRFEEMCRHRSVFCERREVSSKEASDVQLEQPGDALFKRPKERGAYDLFFIRTSPGSEPE